MKKIFFTLIILLFACVNEDTNFIPFEGTVFVSNNILNSSDNSFFS